MKGLFIPDITAEMFRNGCLESIEALMAEGEIYDIDYEPEPHWIPCSERLPEDDGVYLVTIRSLIDEKVTMNVVGIREYTVRNKWLSSWQVVAWMRMMEPYKEVEE